MNTPRHPRAPIPAEKFLDFLDAHPIEEGFELSIREKVALARNTGEIDLFVVDDVLVTKYGVLPHEVYGVEWFEFEFPPTYDAAVKRYERRAGLIPYDTDEQDAA